MRRWYRISNGTWRIAVVAAFAMACCVGGCGSDEGAAGVAGGDGSAVADGGGGGDASGGQSSGTDAGRQSSGTDAGTDSGQSSGTDTTGDDTSADPCPQAGHFLDVSAAPGAGSGYPKPTLSAACEADEVVIKSNTIPHYSFVAMTPNPLQAVDNTYRFPRAPKAAAQTTAIPLLGRIGVAVNGMPLFGPNEAAQPAESAWGDPVYNQITDECTGHTAAEYHYHALQQKCLTMAAMVAEPWKLADVDASQPSPVLGYALDGFAIYGPYECKDAGCSSVVEMKSGYDQIADPKKDAWDAYKHVGSTDPQRLDACNGHVGPGGDYHYHATATFPYILGCYRGTPDTTSGTDGGGGGGGDGGGGGGGGGGPGQPTACTTEADCGGAACGPDAKAGCTCQQTPQGKACIPKCKTTADCPTGGPQTLMCTPQGFCAPGMGG
ncbi:MAG: hypothetical protein RIT45_2516 [Pseudomonadota bacterium]